MGRQDRKPRGWPGIVGIVALCILAPILVPCCVGDTVGGGLEANWSPPLTAGTSADTLRGVTRGPVELSLKSPKVSWSTVNFSSIPSFPFAGAENASAGAREKASFLSPPKTELEKMEDIRDLVARYRIAPPSRDFREAIDRLKSLQDGGQSSHPEGEEPLGLIPSPIDIVFLASVGTAGVSATVGAGGERDPAAYGVSWAATLPARYDLRSTGKLTPVRAQGQCGACWAFSSLGSLESTELPLQEWDFSENHMKNNHGFDLSPCQGGNYLMAAAYLARWAGPVNEADDPYSESARKKAVNPPVRQHVQEITFMPSRAGPLDNGRLKAAILQNGAVYSSIRWERSYYSPEKCSYYYPGSSIQNHAVVIVGWDDDYHRENFAVTPPGDGAFIVRNSWGAEWGDGGYFYVSYYDTVIGRELVQFFGDDTSNYDRIYSYDPLGWVTALGTGGETLYAANVFTAAGNEELRAVSFYTPVRGTSYQVEVSLDPSNGPRGASSRTVAAGTITCAGYHTVPLDTPVSLAKGEKFSVILKLSTPGYGFPLAVEYPLEGYSGRAVAHAGESYISSDGTTWIDLTKAIPNANACIKAFSVARKTPAVTPLPTPAWTLQPFATPFVPARGDRTPPSVAITSPGPAASFSPGETVHVAWTARDSGGIASVTLEYSLDGGSSWKALCSPAGTQGTCAWKVPDDCHGRVTFRVTAVDTAGNSASASRTVVVRAGNTVALPVHAGGKAVVDFPRKNATAITLPRPAAGISAPGIAPGRIGTRDDTAVDLSGLKDLSLPKNAAGTAATSLKKGNAGIPTGISLAPRAPAVRVR
ncbi:MAG: lectin like domain-containing protein [Methanolinea sp.]|nr:lectin like domain-containing protein [Methanolinea sp.]